MNNIKSIFGVSEIAMKKLFETYPYLIRSGQTIIGTTSQLAIAKKYLSDNGHPHKVEEHR